MAEGRGGGLWAALAWIAFPAVPVVLESFYNGVGHFASGAALPPDPRDWGWFAWLTELGPLLAFAFLAGATLRLPDPPDPGRGPRAWAARRSVWVAFGPWAGFLVGVPTVYAAVRLINALPESVGRWFAGLGQPTTTPAQTAFLYTLLILTVAVMSYGGLVPAVAAVRRARRVGRAWECTRRGLAWSAAFLGSLFGSFWGVTAWWRAYFFDPRIAPVVLAALSLGALTGCGSTLTRGEVRRRELFRSLLLAWTFGLALLWLWWGRPRKAPPA